MAKFATYSHSADGPDDAVQTSALAQPLSNTELIQLVLDYVERRSRPRSRAKSSLRAQQWIYLAGHEALKPAGRSFEDPDFPGVALAELVRRALLELTRMRSRP
jgi:hypothetical protein